MTDAVSRRWTVEEFFAWQERQPERYELVDGFPIRMMAGAKNVHGNSQGGMSLKYHSLVEFAFDERILGDLGLRL
jgi:Uma2 family endonuclease